MKKILLLLSIIIFVSCDNSTEPKDKEFSVEIALSGAVQKGPFLNGTSILITELENNLTPTGRNFTSQIENNVGIFQLPTIEYSSQYIELKADGYYYDEINGNTSTSPLTLYALSDLTTRTSVNVNIFTTLERPRIKYLMAKNIDFNAAKDSTYNEILNIFNFPKDSIAKPEDLNIASSGEENAKLLAMSLIIQGNRSEADFSELISYMSFDLQEDGVINSTSIISDLFNGANSIDKNSVRENLINRYSELGTNANIPDFEKYIDIFIQQQDSIIVSYDRDISCLGDSSSSIDITVSGGKTPYTYLWSNGATTEDIDNIGPDTYSVVISDSYGLTKTVSNIIITEKMTLSANVTHINSVNPKGTIDLIVEGGFFPYNFDWNNGFDTEDISDLDEGEYSVIVTDSNNCQESLSVQIVNSDEKVVDFDGNIYTTVQIGEQLWMAENLKVIHYNNGDEIRYVTDNTEWGVSTTGAYCEYYNDLSNVDLYGRLYNWFCINDSRGISPEGWHVPIKEDWEILINYCGGEDSAGEKLKSTDGWYNNKNGTDEFGFKVLPSGGRGTIGFYGIGIYSGIWSSTQYDSTSSYYIHFQDDNESINYARKVKLYGLPIRLVKN